MNEQEKKIVEKLRRCDECEDVEDCGYGNSYCGDKTIRDYCKIAADLIERLSEELERVKRERDAAVQELTDLEVLIAPSAEMCSICKYAHCEVEVEPCASCKPSYERSKWEWRGVCAENSGGTKND